MKRFLSILFIVFCLFNLVTPALAENTVIGDSDVSIPFDGAYSEPAFSPVPDSSWDDTVTVHAYMSDKDAIPHLWAWEDAAVDVNAFEAWPGEEMHKSGDWWTCQIPSSCNYIIINNSYDHQTLDLAVTPGKDVWVMVYMNWDAMVYYSEPETVTGFPEKLYIVGEGMQGVNDWDVSDPNGLMEGDNGVYNISVNVLKDSIVKFKFCGNGSWDSGYNYGAMVSDVDVRPNNNYSLTNFGYDFMYSAMKDCILTVNVDLNTGILKLQVLVLESTPLPTPTKTVHVRVSEGQVPRLYAWSSFDTEYILSSWPGEEMTYEGDWYTLHIPSEYDSVMIVGSDTAYTGIIELSEYKGEYWVVCDSQWNHKLYREQPRSSDENFLDQLPTVKLYVYAPDAQRLKVICKEMDDGSDFTHLMKASDQKGWWECDIFTDLMFTIYDEVDYANKKVLSISNVQHDFWVVLNEDGERFFYDEAPHNFKDNSSNKQHKKNSNEESASESPVIMFFLIGVGVVALAINVVAVVLLLRRKRG